MITIEPDDEEIKALIRLVDDASKALEKALSDHDVSNPSMYEYCKSHDALQAAKHRLYNAYTSLGRLVYLSL